MEKLPSLRKLFEDDETQFGTEISLINDWFDKKYTDKSYSFSWDGKELVVKDGDDKEIEKLTREDLSKDIDFPKSVKEARTDSPAKSVFGKKIAKSINDSAKQLSKEDMIEVLNYIADWLSEDNVSAEKFEY